MKTNSLFILASSIIMVAVTSAVAVPASAQVSPIVEGFQSAFDYLGESASDDNRGGWFNETQGIANDENYWYFSKNIDSNQDTYIFKVPYSQHLADNFSYTKQRILAQPTSWSGICQHIGDIDIFEYNSVSYIVAPYEECDDTAVEFVIVFLADDVNGDGTLLEPVAVFGVGTDKVAWAAVHEPTGDIYWGSDYAGMHRQGVDWDAVEAGECIGEMDLCNTGKNKIYLTDPQGNEFVEFEGEGTSTDMTMMHQGGDFSTDGSLFYLLSGAEIDGTCRDNEKSIHVFDTTTWRRIKKSYKSTGPFKYQTEYCGVLTEAIQEPEGISYYDVNAIADSQYHSDMPRGELHAMILHNDGGDDSVTVKHYSGIIDVYPDEDDIIESVFYDYYNGHGTWDGAYMRLHEGVYYVTDDMFLDGAVHKVRIVPEVGDGGTIRVVAKGAIVLE